MAIKQLFQVCGFCIFACFLRVTQFFHSACHFTGNNHRLQSTHSPTCMMHDLMVDGDGEEGNILKAKNAEYALVAFTENVDIKENKYDQVLTKNFNQTRMERRKIS